MAVPAPGRQTPDESKDFGVGSLALPLEDPAADDVHVKNGWIADDGSGLWSAGTAGYATVQGTDLEVAVLLEDAWRAASRVRDAGMLWKGRPVDSLPSDLRDVDGMARIVGADPGQPQAFVDAYNKLKSTVDTLVAPGDP